MGIHDRDYYRGPESSSGIPRGGIRDWSMVTTLIVVTAGFHLLGLLEIGGEKHALTRLLSASPRSLTHPYLWWQLVTYGFAHSWQEISHIFWNMFGLWIFGRQVEDVYGKHEFLRFYLTAIFLGGVGWCLRALALGGMNELLLGASGAVTAVTLLFCLNFPRQTILLMMVLPVPAWILGIMIIVGNLFSMQAWDAPVAYDVHLIGAIFAILYFRFHWHLGRWWPNRSWRPFSWLGWRRRPALRVHHPLEDASEKDQSRPEDDLEREADRLLQKVSEHGIDSLTAAERSVLERYSRRMRNRRS